MSVTRYHFGIIEFHASLVRKEKTQERLHLLVGGREKQNKRHAIPFARTRQQQQHTF
jgi:hypothetical protein